MEWGKGKEKKGLSKGVVGCKGREKRGTIGEKGVVR